MNTIQLINLKNTVSAENYFTAKNLNDADISCHEINDATNRRNNNKLNAEVLIDYIIKTHHAFAKKSTIAIYNLTQKVTYRHSEKHVELKKFNEIAFLFFHHLLNQMLKEEQSLFPHVRQTMSELKYQGKNNNAIIQPLKEKLQLQQAELQKSFDYLKTFREITNDYKLPPDACSYYTSLFDKMKELESDLVIHFHLEADILFGLCNKS